MLVTQPHASLQCRIGTPLLQSGTLRRTFLERSQYYPLVTKAYRAFVGEPLSFEGEKIMKKGTRALMALALVACTLSGSFADAKPKHPHPRPLPLPFPCIIVPTQPHCIFQ